MTESMIQLTAQILIRRDTAANLASVVPAQSEPVYETDTQLLKIGDGITPTPSLPAVSAGTSGGSASIPYDAPTETYKPTGTPAIPSIDPATSLLPPAMMSALDARYPVGAAVKPWAPSTTYTLGQPVVSPTGDVVTAASAHTSGSTFSGFAPGGNWNLSTTFARAWAPSTAYTSGQVVVTPNGDLATATSSFTSGATFTASNWHVNAAPLQSPVFTGVPTAPTAAPTDSSGALANTAFVQALIATVAATFGVAIVAWDATAKTWTATARPTAAIVLLISTNDPAAVEPSWRQNGDAWIEHPDAAS